MIVLLYLVTRRKSAIRSQYGAPPPPKSESLLKCLASIFINFVFEDKTGPAMAGTAGLGATALYTARADHLEKYCYTHNAYKNVSCTVNDPCNCKYW